MEALDTKSLRDPFIKVAAKIMGTDSYNGWTYWHCNLNGSNVLIDSLRQKKVYFREKKI